MKKVFSIIVFIAFFILLPLLICSLLGTHTWRGVLSTIVWIYIFLSIALFARWKPLAILFYSVNVICFLLIWAEFIHIKVRGALPDIANWHLATNYAMIATLFPSWHYVVIAATFLLLYIAIVLFFHLIWNKIFTLKVALLVIILLIFSFLYFKRSGYGTPDAIKNMGTIEYNIRKILDGYLTMENVPNHKEQIMTAFGKPFRSIPSYKVASTPYYSLPKRTNVLLLVLESYGISCIENTPLLNEIRKRGVDFRYFIMQQAQTHRGLGAILTGRYPVMPIGLALMEMVKDFRDIPVDFIHSLKEAGYYTAFLQAASLDYMNKGVFMKSMGFDLIKGAESFDKSDIRGWGVDDEIFFNRVFDEIMHINKSTAPWFICTLNVGTHAPFTLPRKYDNVPIVDKSDLAFKIMDAAVAKLIKRLDENGILTNTLVIVAPDEGIGILNTSIEGRMVAGNHGVAFMLHPSLPSEVVEYPVGQIDIVPSILALLNINSASCYNGLPYYMVPQQREFLLFGNIYNNVIGCINNEKLFYGKIHNSTQEYYGKITWDDRLYYNYSGIRKIESSMKCNLESIHQLTSHSLFATQGVDRIYLVSQGQPKATHFAYTKGSKLKLYLEADLHREEMSLALPYICFVNNKFQYMFQLPNIDNKMLLQHIKFKIKGELVMPYDAPSCYLGLHFDEDTFDKNAVDFSTNIICYADVNPPDEKEINYLSSDQKWQKLETGFEIYELTYTNECILSLSKDSGFFIDGIRSNNIISIAIKDSNEKCIVYGPYHNISYPFKLSFEGKISSDKSSILKWDIVSDGGKILHTNDTLFLNASNMFTANYFTTHILPPMTNFEFRLFATGPLNIKMQDVYLRFFCYTNLFATTLASLNMNTNSFTIDRRLSYKYHTNRIIVAVFSPMATNKTLLDDIRYLYESGVNIFKLDLLSITNSIVVVPSRYYFFKFTKNTGDVVLSADQFNHLISSYQLRYVSLTELSAFLKNNTNISVIANIPKGQIEEILQAIYKLNIKQQIIPEVSSFESLQDVAANGFSSVIFNLGSQTLPISDILHLAKTYNIVISLPYSLSITMAELPEVLIRAEVPVFQYTINNALMLNSDKRYGVYSENPLAIMELDKKK